MALAMRKTNHARSRQAQRNLSDADVRFVLAHGKRFYCAGALHVFLGRRDIPAEREVYQRNAHLEGTVLVLRPTDGILLLVTTYRNRHALKAIRHKTRFDARRQILAQKVGLAQVTELAQAVGAEQAA